MRSLQRELGIKEFCETHGLASKYRTAITWTINAWTGDLDADEIDNLILLALKQALKLEGWIEDDVPQRYSLPPHWTSDDSNWDQFREAVAVCLIESYYDSLS